MAQTWLINDEPDVIVPSSQTYTINFVSNNTAYTSFRIFYDWGNTYGINYGDITVLTYTPAIPPREPEAWSWYNNVYKTVTFSTDPTDSLLTWLQSNATLQSSGYSITYHPNGGTPTPTDLTAQTTLPNPLPTVSKSGYRFAGWYTDSTFTTQAVAGATIETNTDLYAKFVDQETVDITSLSGYSSITAGQHSLTIKAKASGYADSEASTAVTFTKLAAPTSLTASGTEVTFEEASNASSYDVYADGTYIGNSAGEPTWEYPTQSGDELTIPQTYSATQSGSELTIQ